MDKKNIHWLSWDRLCRERIHGGLGFRDIADFNQALLAKQSWRPLQNPQSLLALVYKDRYHRHVNILQSSSGNRPSYAWRSLQFGKDLLLNGLQRSIGNGSDTLVASSNWIFDAMPRSPIFKPNLRDDTLLVSDLLYLHGSWNLSRLNNYFPSSEVQLILHTHFDLHFQDGYLWPFSAQGNYTVKSGYDFKRRSLQATSTEQDPLRLQIWQLTAPKKIKLFWWRALSEALPVRDRLYSKLVPLDPLCNLCSKEPETVNHSLFLCDQARDILDLAEIPSPQHGFQNHSVTENIAYLLHLMHTESTNAELRRAMPWLLWEIWKNRNAYVFRNRLEDLCYVKSKAFEDAALWFSVQLRRRPTLSCSQPNTGTWHKPPQDIFKCNVHIAWRGPHYLSGFSWITRDNSGQAQHHAGDALQPYPCATEATLNGIMLALRSLRDLHYEDIILECSLRKAIDAIQNPRDWPRFRHCLHQISLISHDFRSVVFGSVCRTANLPAVAIASSVTREGRFTSYLSIGGPAWLHSLLHDDNILSSDHFLALSFGSIYMVVYCITLFL